MLAEVDRHRGGVLAAAQGDTQGLVAEQSRAIAGSEVEAIGRGRSRHGSVTLGKRSFPTIPSRLLLSL